jgi:cysteine-rich repeat protein
MRLVSPPRLHSFATLAIPLFLVYQAKLGHAASCVVPLDGPCPTIQAALNQANPGDVISVNTGLYSEKLSIPTGGTAGNPITLQASPGHHPILDGTGVPGANMIRIDGSATPKSHIVVRGLEIRNNIGVSDGSGIRIVGAGTGIELRDNEIHNITGDHAMGITVYATEATPVADLIIDGNIIHDCEPAQSEALTLNGNVDGFEITNNVVRDVNSIGIDCIGGETDIQPNPTLVCRNGIIRGNTVIRANADYDGGFGGGIYVDGGRDIVIENNFVTESDLGIEVGAENAGLVTQNVKVRNNVIYKNEKAGIVFGGYASSVGRANDNEFRGNTLYLNNTVGESGQGRFFSGNGIGEIWIQFGESNVVENNLVFAGPENVFIASYDSGSSVDNTFDYNLFHSAAGVAAGHLILNGVEYFGFAAWQAGTGQDASSAVGDPLLADPSNGDFHIAVTSPAVNAGNPGFVPDVGELDLDGQPRAIGAAIDIGVDEGTCGNGGAPDPGEACDDGNNLNCDGCDNDCTLSATCGNGIACATFGEDCDDGNTLDGDCCSMSCSHEASGGSCSDQNACTLADVCDGSGACSGTPTGGPACALQSDVRRCQESIAKSGRQYFDARLKSLQRCRNDLNKGKILYFDAAKSIPIAGPDDCGLEYVTISRTAKAAGKARASVAGRCTDSLTAQLFACASTVDGLVSPDTTGGCVLTTHAGAAALMIDDEYGAGLTGMELGYVDLRRCQEQVAKAGRLYSTTHLKQVQNCRNKLNRGHLLYFDAGKTMPLVNPADCRNEASAAARIAKAGLKARSLVERRCTDTLLAGLSDICAVSVDALTDSNGANGCLISGHDAQATVMHAAEY